LHTCTHIHIFADTLPCSPLSFPFPVLTLPLSLTPFALPLPLYHTIFLNSEAHNPSPKLSPMWHSHHLMSHFSPFPGISCLPWNKFEFFSIASTNSPQNIQSSHINSPLYLVIWRAIWSWILRAKNIVLANINTRRLNPRISDFISFSGVLVGASVSGGEVLLLVVSVCCQKKSGMKPDTIIESILMKYMPQKFKC